MAEFYVNTQGLVTSEEDLEKIGEKIKKCSILLENVCEDISNTEGTPICEKLRLIVEQIKCEEQMVKLLGKNLAKIHRLYGTVEDEIMRMDEGANKKSASESEKNNDNSTELSDMTYQEYLQYRIDNAVDENAKKIYEEYMKNIYIKDESYSETAYYDNFWNFIKYNKEDDEKNVRGIGCTYFHEVGHLIDDQSDWFGTTSTDSDYNFYDKLEADVDNYIDKIMNDKGYTNRDDAYDDLSKWLNTDGNMKNGISDLVNGLTNGKACGGWAHDDDYYTEKSTSREAFAHFFEAGMSSDSTKLDYIKEIFPEAYEEYQRMLEDELG